MSAAQAHVEHQPSTRKILTPEQASCDMTELRSSLADLALLANETSGLAGLLERISVLAVRAVPGAEGASVALLQAEGPETEVEALAASHPFVSAIDDIQYGIVNEGPSVTSVRERRTVRSGSLGGEKMWPRFGPRVGRLGVHSALSTPLLLPDGLVGAINVYARAKDVFDYYATEFGELFAAPAAVAVHNAQLLAQAETLATQLQKALSTRPVIDQAIGILRGRSGGTAEEAFTRLRVISQREHVKLADVAQKVLDDAVRRAHVRHCQPTRAAAAAAVTGRTARAG